NLMKSAWELAMERLDAEDPDVGKTLTEEKKTELAAIDTKYSAKIAERKIFLEKALNEAIEQSDLEEIGNLQRQIADETTRLEEERERAKEKARADS
ncbi:MAG: ComEC/Rec2 family competence protein, partial [Opitutales bacterium]